MRRVFLHTSGLWLLTVMGTMAFTPTPSWATGWERLWPGKSIFLDSASDIPISWPPFPKDQALDFIRNVGWQTVVPTGDSNICGDMWFRENGNIDYDHTKSRKCGKIYGYEVVKVTDYYVVFYVHELSKKVDLKYRLAEFWSVMRVDKYEIGIMSCGAIYFIERKSVRGQDPLLIAQDRLLDIWNHSAKCNPDLMPPDRHYFWGDSFGPVLYDAMNMDHNPHWSLDGYDPSPRHDRPSQKGR